VTWPFRPRPNKGLPGSGASESIGPQLSLLREYDRLDIENGPCDLAPVIGRENAPSPGERFHEKKPALTPAPDTDR
jgi:hypothetical protein